MIPSRSAAAQSESAIEPSNSSVQFVPSNLTLACATKLAACMDYYIAHTKTPVKITLQAGEAQPVSIFLPQGDLDERKFDRIAQLLEDSSRFLPVETSSGTRLVQKSAIESLEVSAAAMEERSWSHEAALRQPVLVRVHTLTGRFYEGQLWVEQPAGAARTLDELNRAREFIALHGVDNVVFVGTRLVSTVEEVKLEESV